MSSDRTGSGRMSRDGSGKMSSETIMNSLIINYLPQFITDEEYKNMLISIGPIQSSKIVRDKSTGFSYGFGFVEYQADRDAARAVKIFDGLPMYGKRIRVQHANKTDEHAKAYNLYVKNIPSTYTETDLDKLFEPFGKIKTSKVLMDLQTGQSRNIGFVLFETKSESDKAISEMNGKTITGSTTALYVKYADDAQKKSTKNIAPMLPQVLSQPPPSFPASSPQGNGFTPPTPPGPVRNQVANRNRYNPMSRSVPPPQDFPVPNFNVGQQNYSSNPNPNYNSNGQNYNSNGQNYNSNNSNQQNYNSNQQNYSAPKQQNAGYFGAPSTPQNSGMSSPDLEVPKGAGPFAIFVFNIGDDAEEQELWALFSPYGTVQKCTVMMDNDRKVCKGYGFVDMANANEATNAIKSLNGFFYKGKQLNVSFKQKRQ